MIDFNAMTRTVSGPDRPVVLSPAQATMLAALPVYPNAITTADLVRKVWDRDPAIRKNIVHCRTIINQLRGCLADAGFKWHAVHSEYRKGYSLRLAAQQGRAANG